ncbi:MAG: response regulator transcription factor [Planctomycetales bacterium]|nr:response regulator transcription factor [Planctomycetales bacterium]
MPIRLLIVDDHDVVRAGLRRMLEQERDIEVLAEASDGEQALEAARRHRPNLVLLDVRMPRVDGLACLAKLRSEFPEVPVLLLSGYDNPTYQARAVALGAAGYLDKTAPAPEIVNALRSVARGESLWSTETLRKLSGAMATPRLPAELEAALTQREHDVLKQLANGLSNKEIALALSISYETVKEHVQHILRKIGVADRTQAAVWAVRNGLV